MRKVPDQWLSSILLSMYQRPAVTREEIIRATQLNGGSVSQALRYLMDSGTILKIGELKSKAGRRRDVLKLNPEAGYFIAVDLETARIRYALTSLVGDIRFRWEQELDFEQGPHIANLLAGIEILGIRCQNRAAGFIQCFGRGSERQVFLRGARARHRPRRLARLPADPLHVLFDVHGGFQLY